MRKKIFYAFITLLNPKTWYTTTIIININLYNIIIQVRDSIIFGYDNSLRVDYILQPQNVYSCVCLRVAAE